MKNPKADISLVIITFNKAFELDLVLISLSVQDFDTRRFEVVVVND
jgi:glycosyltransferase involved in cell wall biosynthesis